MFRRSPWLARPHRPGHCVERPFLQSDKKGNPTGKIISPHRWKWSDVSKFVDLKQKSTLKLPVRSQNPSSRVFAALSLKPHNLKNDTYPEDHANISATMAHVGIPPLADPERDAVLLDTTRMVRQLAIALKVGASGRCRGKTIDGRPQYAKDLLQVGGFGDDPFTIDFTVFGTYHFGSDRYVVQTRSNDPVLVFETKDKYMPAHGYLGQIVGEMMSVLSANAKIPVLQNGKKPVPSVALDGQASLRSVFAVRLHHHRVSFFSMSADLSQIQDLCVCGIAPRKKLQLLSTVRTPNASGWSLINSSERRKALDVLGRVRGEVIAGASFQF